MENMGALQLGLHTPTMILQGWNILIIDLKDCFFTIYLNSKDAEKFAFSIPTINKQEPMERYHWVVLPQGMKNSPTICQSYVSQALRGFRQQNSDLIIYHYMDDILIAGKRDLSEKLKELTTQLSNFGLKIAPEKVQKMQPWKYLGWKILEKTIVPQKLEITDKIETLNDVQNLLGTINWVQTLLGIDNELLTPLFEML